MPPFEIRVDQELLLEFFLTFSRFEYALKDSGYYERPNNMKIKKFKEKGILPEVKPDWDSFAKSLLDLFRKDRTEALKQACEYILDSPPMKQVITNNGIAWETPLTPDSESEVVFLLRMVRCIRNNLFHGGKYNIEVHVDTKRTEMLLRSSLVILEECRFLATQVRQAFDKAVI